MTSKPWSSENVENEISFQIDFKDWQNKLTKQEMIILSHLMQGNKAKQIAEILLLNYNSIRQIIILLKEKFLEYFSLAEYALP